VNQLEFFAALLEGQKFPLPLWISKKSCLGWYTKIGFWKVGIKMNIVNFDTFFNGLGRCHCGSVHAAFAQPPACWIFSLWSLHRYSDTTQALYIFIKMHYSYQIEALLHVYYSSPWSSYITSPTPSQLMFQTILVVIWTYLCQETTQSQVWHVITHAPLFCIATCIHPILRSCFRSNAWSPINEKVHLKQRSQT